MSIIEIEYQVSPSGSRSDLSPATSAVKKQNIPSGTFGASHHLQGRESFLGAQTL